MNALDARQKAGPLPPRVKAIIRQFPENGLKLLLQHPANVRDLLGLSGTPVRELIDFERMRVTPTSAAAAGARTGPGQFAADPTHRALHRRAALEVAGELDRYRRLGPVTLVGVAFLRPGFGLS